MKFRMLFPAVLINFPNSKACLIGEWSVELNLDDCYSQPGRWVGNYYDAQKAKKGWSRLTCDQWRSQGHCFFLGGGASSKRRRHSGGGPPPNFYSELDFSNGLEHNWPRPPPPPPPPLTTPLLLTI